MKEDKFLMNKEKNLQKNNYKFYSASAKDNPEGFRNFIEELVKDYIAAFV